MSSTNGDDKKEKAEEARSVYFHEDGLYHTRVNFFLAVQALTFVAWGTVWAAEQTSPCVLWLVTFLGCFLTVAVGYTLVTLGCRIRLLHEDYKKANLNSAYVRVDCKLKAIPFGPAKWRFRVETVYSFIIPLGFAALWIMLIGIGISKIESNAAGADYVISIVVYLILALAFVILLFVYLVCPWIEGRKYFKKSRTESSKDGGLSASKCSAGTGSIPGRNENQGSRES